MGKEFDRRTFLKGAMAGALGIAATGVGIPVLAEEKGVYALSLIHI